MSSWSRPCRDTTKIYGDAWCVYAGEGSTMAGWAHENSLWDMQRQLLRLAMLKSDELTLTVG